MDSVEPIDRTSAARLAELVVHLTDCDPQQAVGLIDVPDAGPAEGVDKLAIVARAMVRLRRAGSPPPANIDLREALVQHDLRETHTVADLRDEAATTQRDTGTTR
jgi:hypothetical protein